MEYQYIEITYKGGTVPDPADFPTEKHSPQYKGTRVIYAEQNGHVVDTDEHGKEIPSTAYYFNSTRAFLIDPARLAMPEREFLIDYNDIARLTFPPIMRPDIKLTREECNTRYGRAILTGWISGFPHIINGVESLQGGTPNDVFDYNSPDFWDIRYLRHVGLDFSNFDGLFEENGAVFPKYSIYTQFDVILAAQVGKELTTRDEVVQVGEQILQPVPRWLYQYDKLQLLVDCDFAFYELMRTEQYSSIAHFPKEVQRVAIKNYFALFNAYGFKPDNKHQNKEQNDANLATWAWLRYKKPLYVISEVSKRLGIPREILTYAKRTQKNDPLERLLSNRVKEQSEPLPSYPIKGRELDLQRTNRSNPSGTQLTFFDEIYKPNQNDKEPVNLNQWIYADTKNKKLFAEIVFQICNQPDFRENVEKLAKLRSPQKIAEFSKNIKTIAVPLNDILKYFRTTIKTPDGKTRTRTVEECRKEFKKLFENMPREKYLIPIPDVINKKIGEDASGKDIIKPAMQKRKGKNQYKQTVAIWGRPFYLEDVIITPAERGGYKYEDKHHIVHIVRNNYTAMIRPGVIYYANILDNKGKPANYDTLTPGWLNFHREMNNTDNVTPAVEKIIHLIYIKRCAAAKGNYFKAKKDAKENKKKLTSEVVETTRQISFTLNLKKQDLLDDVISNIDPEYIRKKKRADIMKRIEQALESLRANELYIENFKSSKDNSAWVVTFKAPSTNIH